MSRAGSVWSVATLVLTLLTLLVGAGCASVGSGGTQTGIVRIVAAENVWGSIARQVGGKDVTVTNLIDNPNADPHEYEPTPADARAVASADLVIVNGVGYDAWIDKLLAVSAAHRTVIDIGDLVGAKAGDNPHLWYDPASVRTFIARLTSDLKGIRPAAADDFERGRATFESSGLREYDSVLTSIKRTYAGTPVGASESIFSMLAPALDLRLITPPRFLAAISEGTEVSAADAGTIDRQIDSKQIKIYVYNSQNTTPDVQGQLKACRAKGIPTAAITETMVPASTTYQHWQSAQLRGIAAALAEATGR